MGRIILNLFKNLLKFYSGNLFYFLLSDQITVTRENFTVVTVKDRNYDTNKSRTQ